MTWCESQVARFDASIKLDAKRKQRIEDALTVCGKTWKLKFFSLLRVIAFGVFDRSRRFLMV
jgi:hypothetical protein